MVISGCLQAQDTEKTKQGPIYHEFLTAQDSTQDFLKDQPEVERHHQTIKKTKSFYKIDNRSFT